MARRSSRTPGSSTFDRAPDVLPRLSRLSLLEDRRHFHPLGPVRPALSLLSTRPRIVVRKRAPGGKFALSPHLSFEVPKSVAVCIRRKQRREVLFANKKTRGGAGSKRRRNFWSLIRCS
ncbi:hypothetical protein [Microviridae sp.]|nr:hypothetical protein [Microviridae sp.]